MKGSLIVIVFFCVGCIMGAFNKFEFDTHTVSMYILYALMLQVGISIGSNKNLKAIISHLHPKMLLIPLGTIIGTLLFSALASLLLRQWSVFDCMAVGSGFAYYSLSSILITQFKEPSIGLQLATELGTIALLTNIFREMMALLGTPIIKKYFGKLAPISAAGVNSMDVLLPSITRYSGKEMIPIAILHGKIRGVKDAQSVGANLVSFNSSAYESYGRDKAQGLNAPVGKYAAFAYVTALNALLANSEHRLIISDTTVVFWAESANPDFQILFNAAMNPKEDNQKMLCAILEKISRGLPPKEGVNPETPFYILGLAPNAARLSVRFFLQDSFGNFLKHIQQHYSDMEIEKAPYEFPYLSPYWLLRETVNPNAKDKSGSHLLSGAVMRSILTGAPYPQALMNAVMLRIHAEQDDSERHIKKITRGRAAIIKGYLIRRHRGEEEYKEVLQVSINEESKNKAYVLGRLFAILEKAQLEAYPNINTTIKDRYFTSACATPGSVFPTLIKLSRHHIRVIKDIKLKCYLDNQIKDLIDKLDVADTPFPAHFSLEDQGSFVLGYYQQTQKRYMKKSDSDVKEEA